MAFKTATRCVLGLGLSCLASTAALAADAMYLSMPGVTGHSTAATRKGQIDISSLQWGAMASTSFTGGGSSIGKASASDIVWTQPFDSTYPQLLTKLNAQPSGTAQFDVVHLGGGGKSTPYLSLKAETMALDSVSFANQDVAASTAMQKITLGWTGMDHTGQAQTSSTVWDLSRNVVTGPTARAPTLQVGSVSPGGSLGATGFAMFLRLGEGSSVIAGDSTTRGYENWISIDSAQFGGSREVNFFGAGSGAGVGKTVYSDLTWTQMADGSLPAVLANLAGGRTLASATLEYVMMGAGGPVTFMQMVMQNVAFTGLSLSSGGYGVQTSESLTFGKFSQTAWSLNADGTQGAATKFGYDIGKGTTSAAVLATNEKGFGTGNLTGFALADAAPNQSDGGGPIGAIPPVPEPGQWALMLAGLGLLAGLARRRVGRCAALSV